MAKQWNDCPDDLMDKVGAARIKPLAWIWCIRPLVCNMHFISCLTYCSVFSLYFLFSIGLAIRRPNVYSVPPSPNPFLLSYLVNIVCAICWGCRIDHNVVCSGGAPSSLICEASERPARRFALLGHLLKMQMWDTVGCSLSHNCHVLFNEIAVNVGY